MLYNDNMYDVALTQSDCKVDPKKMLEKARCAREKAQADLDMLNMFGSNKYVDRDSVAKITGAMYMHLKDCEKEEQHWIVEVANA